MGVIKDRPRCAIDPSSDEQQQQDTIFPVSDDDTVVGVAVGFPAQPPERQIHRRRQIRTRQPAIPTPSHTVRSGRGGVKKCRRYENQLDLVKNSDLEESREVTIEDLSPNSSNTFARLLEDDELLGIWNEFVGGGGEGPSTGPTLSHANSDDPLSKVCRKLRTMLRSRHLPLGLMDSLEENLLEHFSNKPLCTFESSPLDGFRRALLHALSQYNNLESWSMGQDKKSKVVRVRNKSNEFSPPPVRLVDYIENQRSRVDKF